MPVVISGVANLLGFKLTFGYDKEVLTPLSVDAVIIAIFIKKRKLRQE